MRISIPETCRLLEFGRR